MKVGMNLMFMVPGKVGGSEPLLTNLAAAVASSGHSVVIFALSGFIRSYPELNRITEIVELPWSSGAQGMRIITEHTWLALEARKRRLDIIHHGVGTTPFWNTVPSAVTIHDVQYRHYPENFVKLKRKWLDINVPHSIKRCAVVCVPSEFVRKDILAMSRDMEFPEDRIQVVPFGSENLFGPEGAEEPDVVRSSFRLDRPFFFYPGRTYPHKNHHLLVQAFAPLASEADLVFTGPNWFLDRQLESSIRRTGLMGKVRHLGLVSRRALGGLYRAALGLVYPSRFEGFGAPILEAMSVGCPVVASDVTAIPEVAGDSAVLLSPDDLEAWTEVMGKLLNDGELRRDLSRRGLKRAAEFSWKRSATQQIKGYEYALGS